MASSANQCEAAAVDMAAAAAAAGGAAELGSGEQLHLPGFGSVLLLSTPDSDEAAAALKDSFVYASITAVDSSYMLQLLQPQQAGKLSVLMRLQGSDLAAVLQLPNAAQLLDELYDQHQTLQQQQQPWDALIGEEDDSSMLYIPTDDEDA
jgi:hypothetical protein